jgi:hypothetical protein
MFQVLPGLRAQQGCRWAPGAWWGEVPLESGSCWGGAALLGPGVSILSLKQRVVAGNLSKAWPGLVHICELTLVTRRRVAWWGGGQVGTERQVSLSEETGMVGISPPRQCGAGERHTGTQAAFSSDLRSPRGHCYPFGRLSC